MVFVRIFFLNSLFFRNSLLLFFLVEDINRHMSMCTCAKQRGQINTNTIGWRGAPTFFPPMCGFTFFFSLFLLCLFFLSAPSLSRSTQTAIDIHRYTYKWQHFFSPFSLHFSSSLFREYCLWNEDGGGGTWVHAEMREI